MGAYDIGGQAQEWAADEAAKQCFGEEYGVAVGWSPQPVQTPAGVALFPAWHLLITARNPLLGEPRLHHLVPLGTPEPEEANVRAQVGEGLRLLRDLATRKLSGANGKAPARSG